MTGRPAVEFGHEPNSPQLPEGESSIAIGARWHVALGELKQLTLHGGYQLTASEAQAIGAQPLQRALVVTIAAGLAYTSFNLVGEQLSFADDEERADGLVRGYFKADLLARFELGARDRCFVLVSLGPHLSNVLEVQPGDGEGSAGY